ncbi:MAG: phosphate acyltransferase PlsX [Succinivibrionaceae bacterium]
MGITIALDLMGGDLGPQVSVPAAKQALSLYDDLNLITYGREKEVIPLLRKYDLEKNSRLDFVHTDCVVSSNEDPLQVLRKKNPTSMLLALESVVNKKALGAVSGGSTGALVALSNHLLGTLPNVHRSALVMVMPSANEKGTVFLDLGANINVDANTLYQHALMGSVYAEQVLNVLKPRLALLNIGKEESKGTKLVREASEKIKANKNINYIGFAEGSDIFTKYADVIVTDGYTGNVALKTAEGLYKVLDCKIQSYNSRQFLIKFIKYFVKKKIGIMQPDLYNGSALLGLNGVVVKSHGGANISAMANAVKQAMLQCEKRIPDLIVGGLTQL